VEAPEVVRATLRRERLGLLAREREHVRLARRLLVELEGSAARSRGARGVLDEARRSVLLAEEAWRHGIRDAHRVGASLPALLAAGGLTEGELLQILDEP
jgi:hypothetical protein